MLKIRYNLQDVVLSGWEDNEDNHHNLLAREGEGVAFLDITKPEPSTDYEYWYYDGTGLYRSAKQLPSSFVFIPLNPVMSIPEKVAHIEDFLAEVFK